MKTQLIFFIAILLFSIRSFSQPRYFIDTEFPGGNVNVEKITEDTIWLKPDYRDTEGKWFWWNFKIKNAQNSNLVICFQDYTPFSTHGPVVSLDNGKNWSYLNEDQYGETTINYSFKASDNNVQFAIALPYTQKDLYEFLDQNKSKLIKTDTFCKSRAGRDVERIILKDSNSETKHKVFITCRHHACESTASFVVEGIIESFLKDKELQWCRDNVEFMIIPFVDKDGVERGDQGKNRSPRDHNRDYDGNSVYNTTSTIRKEIPIWAEEDKLKVTIDIHCPWIKGNYNEYIYLVGSEDKANSDQQLKFSQLIEKNITGELKFYAKDYLPYGVSWNKKNSFSKGMSSKSWSVSTLNANLSTSIEVPYANVSGTALTKENARVFGHDVAKAIQEYIKTL